MRLRVHFQLHSLFSQVFAMMLPATLQSPGEQSPLDNTMGVMLIGVIVSAVLYGVSIGQTLYYYTTYSKDAWYLKLLVATTVFFDTLHLIFITQTMYHYLILNYYKPTALTHIVWSVVMEALPTGVTGALVQCFYTYRVYHLSKKSIVLTGVILLLVIGNAGCGTGWVILAMFEKSYTGLLDINALTMTINALSVGADVLISLSLCIIFQTSKTGFRRSDSMLTKLTIFFMNTGLATSMCAIGSLVSLAASPNSLIYALWYFCIGRLYANSLLAALNARNIIRGRTEDVDEISLQTVTPMSHVSSDGRTPNISIRIDTRQQYDAEMALERKEASSMIKRPPSVA
ncbi:hypothetical protein CPB85DRAFT_1350236 [Mucidula mucida]|nr:hypothetical protein CPB85DRAFT_1350236 [Mucidula mucida]